MTGSDKHCISGYATYRADAPSYTTSILRIKLDVAEASGHFERLASGQMQFLRSGKVYSFHLSKRRKPQGYFIMLDICWQTANIKSDHVYNEHNGAWASRGSLAVVLFKQSSSHLDRRVR